MTGPPVAGVVLAAGLSSRMGAGFKLLLPFGDGVVVQAPVEAALEAGLDPVVVVTGHRGDEVRTTLEERFRSPAGDLRIVFNPRFPEGQAKSLARGVLEVRTATDAAAAAVALGDEPGIRAETVREVVETWRRRASPSREGPPPGAATSTGPRPAGPMSRTGPAQGSRDVSSPDPEPPVPPVVRARYRDRPGHPVVFPRDVFGELEALEGDRGARGWLRDHAGRVEEVALDRAAPVDVDTEADYREAAGGGRGPTPKGGG